MQNSMRRVWSLDSSSDPECLRFAPSCCDGFQRLLQEAQAGLSWTDVQGGASLEEYMKQPRAHSPWHDIRLRATHATYSMVVEIPKGGTSKYEVDLCKQGNPIIENTKASAKLRKFGRPVPFNYGMFPQTFCHPEDRSELGVGGDSAPLDAVELSGETLEKGGAYEVVILGAICYVDGGELDWKILTLRVSTQDDWISLHGAMGVPAQWYDETLAGFQWFKAYAALKGCTWPYGFEIFPAEVATHRIHRMHQGWWRYVRENAQRAAAELWISPRAVGFCMAAARGEKRERSDEDDPESSKRSR